MQVSSNLRLAVALALVTFVVCLLGLRAERGLSKRTTAPTMNETELSVDASGSLTAAHAPSR